MDFLGGRPDAAQAHLLEAWHTHDHEREPLVGAEAAAGLMHCRFLTGRIGEAVEWGDRAAAAAAQQPVLQRRILALQSQVLFIDRVGVGALERVDASLPGPVDCPADELEAIALASVTRVWAEDLDRAISDLRVCAARLRAGAPMRSASQCLTALAQAEYLAGHWDDAAVHAELAVSLAHDADRGYDIPFVHAYATFVPAARGEWEAASDHVQRARGAAAGVGQGAALTAAATSGATVALARGDHDAVLREVASIRAIGNTDVYGRPGVFGWRTLEAEALIGIGELERAKQAVSELERALGMGRLTAAGVAAGRLRAELAAAEDDLPRAVEACADMRRAAERLGQPLVLARVELGEGRHLRALGERTRAINRLRSARARLTALRARPLVEACDRELAACGASVRPGTPPAIVGLTAAELSVAALVAQGRTNRETATELYVSVKAVEFHLHNIFAKLGIHSRRQLAERLRPVAWHTSSS